MMIGSAWFLREWELPTLQVTVSRIFGSLSRGESSSRLFRVSHGGPLACFTRPR